MYVLRNEDGLVVGVFAMPQPGIKEELLEIESEELEEFYTRANIR